MNKYITVSSTIALGIIALWAISMNPFALAQSPADNQTSNQTSSNTTATASTGTSDSNPTKMHTDEAIKALQSGDTNGALMHAQVADKTATGAAKMHLDEAIKALQSGDTNGALMHAQVAQQNL